MNKKKNEHIHIRDKIAIAKIRKFVGEGENICGYLDEIVQSVSKKLKLLKFKNES